MIIVDAHQDIAYNALDFGRDYRRTAYAKRRDEGGIHPKAGMAMLGLPDAILGRVAVAFATIFTAPKSNGINIPLDAVNYETPRGAYERAMAQIDYYNRLADATERVRIIHTRADLDAVLATWAEGTEITDHVQGLVLLMENGDPILEPKQFEEWYERGVRAVGPAWVASRYSGGTGMPGGLTAPGRELLEVMRGLNAILDLSHMAEEAYWQALDQYDGVLIASHSNPRRFRESDRNLSDTMIRALAEREGVVGVVLYNPFLREDWRRPDARPPFSLIIDAIDHVCQVTGSAAHVCIGSDLDGGFGAESVPAGLDTVTDLYSIPAALVARGYSPADVEAIVSGNALRQLRRALP